MIVIEIVSDVLVTRYVVVGVTVVNVVVPLVLV